VKQAGSVRDVVTVAAACAVIAGTIEAGIAAFKLVVLRRFIFLSHDFTWMTPASFLLIVVPITLAVHGLLKVIGRPLALSTILGLLTGVLLFSMLVPYGTLAWWASGCLAAGIGLQVARRAGSARRERWYPQLRRVALVLAVIVAVTGVTVRTARAWTARREVSALPTPAAAAPNVLLIVLDTVRAANLGLYGYQRPTTPALQQWAAESTVFDRAIATAPWTLPSHSSLFTGRTAGELRTDWLTPLSETPRTLAEALRNQGYATGGFVANLFYTSSESGLARGFAHYDDYRISLPLVLFHSSLGRIDIKSRVPQARSIGQAWEALLTSRVKHANVSTFDRRPADQVAAAFLDWQRGVTDRPFFAFLNFFDAHAPYLASESSRPLFSYNRLSSRDRYDAAIAWLDHVVGTLLASLQQRGVLDRTIVIVTSDHGEQFGEHGLIEHGNSLYLPLLNVPLLVRYPPAVPRGLRVGTVVSLRNVAATILDLAGISGGSEIPGTSLAATWRHPGQAVQGDVIAELSKKINPEPTDRNRQGDVVSRMDGRFHYILNGDGQEELYDFIADPEELKNLVSSPAVQTDLARLRARLVQR
jgi:arylsulfatase A-like enzyme